MAKELIFTRVRDKHKQFQTEKKWSLHFYCTECAFPKCFVCQKRKETADTGGAVQHAHTWVCATCCNSKLICVTCGHTGLPDGFALDKSTGQRASQPHCWRCVLEEKRPQLWKKFTKLCCLTCKAQNLTLHSFPLTVAKQILSTPAFSWSRQKPICLACGEKPLLTCSLCAVKANGIDFVSSDRTPPICYRCIFQRDHAIRFATFAGLTCPGCQSKKLTLTGFPPAVARKILTVRSFRFSRAKELCSLCVNNTQGGQSASKI